MLYKKDQMEWIKEEVLDHINTNGFFASYKFNRIFVGLLIYTNPPLPGEIGLLLYIMLKEETIKILDKDET